MHTEQVFPSRHFLATHNVIGYSCEEIALSQYMCAAPPGHTHYCAEVQRQAGRQAWTKDGSVVRNMNLKSYKVYATRMNIWICQSVCVCVFK